MTAEPVKAPVLLIDLSSLFWRAWHATGKDDVSKARSITRELVDKCHQGRFGGTLTALCCDRGRSFRKELNPEYKAQRPEHDRMVLGELRQTQDDLAAAGYLLWGVDGFEGDDVIATACKIALERGHEVTVASADKDLLQLLALGGPEGEDRVRVLRTHHMSVWDRARFVAEYGIPPNLLGDWLALVGDNSDNIRGVPGVGEKTATAMLKAFGGLGSLILAAEAGTLAKVPGIKAGQARAVAQCADSLRDARQLVELRQNVPIRFEDIYEPRAAAAPPDGRRDERDPMPPAADLTETTEEDPMPPEADLTDKQTATDPPPTETAPAPTAAPTQAPAAQADAAPAPAAPPAPEAKALIVKPDYQGPFELAMEPTSLGHGATLAKRMFESRLYSRYPHENALLVAIGRARELGFGAFAAPDLFHVIDDPKKGLSLSPIAHFISALIERDPACEYLMCVETDAEKATYEFKHRRHPRARTHTYSIQEAVDAGLCELEVKARDWTPDPKDGKPGKDGRSNWDKRRAEMLRKTCVVQVGRIYFSNAALGLYSVEEMTDGHEVG